jgi:predicted house-cleaning NTP pyrophosphatase (Maf/HAM1 superfamily)
MAASALASRGALLPVVLGSSSSSRRGVLAAFRVPFTVLAPDIDEKAVAGRAAGGGAGALALAVAHAKLDALLPRAAALFPRGCLVIAADQVVLGPRGDDGAPREKPEDAAEARAMVASYSGASASTVSAVVVAALPPAAPSEPPRRAAGVEISTVRFLDFDAGLVEAALAPARAVPLAALLPLCSGAGAGAGGKDEEERYGSQLQHGRDEAAASVFSCAGALCVEHPAYAGRIERIEGSLDSLHGLPFMLLLRLAREATGNEAFAFARDGGGGATDAAGEARL